MKIKTIQLLKHLTSSYLCPDIRFLLLLISVFFCPSSSILLVIISTKFSIVEPLLLPDPSLFPIFSCFSPQQLLNGERSDLDVEVFLWDIFYRYVEIHMIIWEILVNFKRRSVHLCHGFLVDFYQFAPPFMAAQSPLRANLKVDVPDFRPPHRLVFHPTVFSTSGLTERQKKKINAVSFLLFLSFNWKTQGAPSIPRYKRQKCLFLIFIVYLSTLVCWINHFNPVINKRTNGWMSLPSDY